MGAKLTEEGKALLGCYFLSCNMFEATRLVRESASGTDIDELFRGKEEFFDPKPLSAFCGNEITPQKVNRYFGGKPHAEKILLGTTSGLWLPADPPELRIFFHLALPLENGVYKNEGIELPLLNLVPVGGQGTRQIAHLGMVFDPRCEPGVLEEILEEQAGKLADVLKVMSRFGNYDFGKFKHPKLTVEVAAKNGI